MTIIALFFCFLFGMLLPCRNIDPQSRQILVFAAIIICFVKVEFLQSVGYSDGFGYFFNPRNLDWGVGTAFVTNFAQAIRPITGYNNIYGMSLLFCILPICALVIIYDSAWPYLARHGLLHRRIFDCVVLAGVGFWGAGIGKDGFSALGVALIIRSLVTDRRPISLQIVTGIVLIACVRPHIAAIAITCIGLAAVASSNDSSKKGIVVATLFGILGVALIPFVAAYVGLDVSFSIAAISEQLDDRATNFEGSGSYVDLLALPAPLRVASFVLRPVIFEANSAFLFLAALQNILIAYMLLRLALCWRIWWEQKTVGGVFIAAFVLTGCVVLGLAISNLGLATRQKFMFIPALAILWLTLDYKGIERPGKRVKR